MELTIATLVHRVPTALRDEGRRTIEAAPGFLKARDGVDARSPAEAAWSLVDGTDGTRAAMVPVPIAVALIRGDRGPLAMMLGIDIDGALAFAWREGGRTTIVRPGPGGLTDPVVREIDHLLDHSTDLRCEGPTDDALDVIRRIRAGLVGEVEHRPLDMRRATGDRPLPHPWLDDVFAAVARHHGADQRDLLRTANVQGKIPSWIWIGETAAGSDPGALPGNVVGLPAAMPPFHLQNRDDTDILKLGTGRATYRRRGRERFLSIARSSFPETVWAGIGPGTPASRIWDLPGLDAYQVGRVEEGETTLLHLVPRG